MDNVGTRADSVVNRRDKFDRNSDELFCVGWRAEVDVFRVPLRGGEMKAFIGVGVVSLPLGDCCDRKRQSSISAVAISAKNVLAPRKIIDYIDISVFGSFWFSYSPQFLTWRHLQSVLLSQYLYKGCKIQCNSGVSLEEWSLAPMSA